MPVVPAPVVIAPAVPLSPKAKIFRGLVAAIVLGLITMTAWLNRPTEPLIVTIQRDGSYFHIRNNTRVAWSRCIATIAGQNVGVQDFQPYETVLLATSGDTSATAVELRCGSRQARVYAE